MATAKTTPPTQTTEGISVASIADTGASLTRLLVALIPLPVTLAKNIGASLTQLIAGVTKSLGGAATPQPSNDIAKATGDLVNASAGLYLSLFRVALSSLNSARRAVDAAVAEANAPRK